MWTFGLQRGLPVRALRAVPVVVARREVDRHRLDLLEGPLQERDGVRGVAGLLEQVAGAEQGIGVDHVGQADDGAERLAERLAPPAGRKLAAAEPGEGGVQVEIRKEDDLHDALMVNLPSASFRRVRAAL